MGWYGMYFDDVEQSLQGLEHSVVIFWMAFQPKNGRGRCGSCCSCSTRGWQERGKGTYNMTDQSWRGGSYGSFCKMIDDDFPWAIRILLIKCDFSLSQCISALKPGVESSLACHIYILYIYIKSHSSEEKTLRAVGPSFLYCVFAVRRGSWSTRSSIIAIEVHSGCHHCDSLHLPTAS